MKQKYVYDDEIYDSLEDIKEKFIDNYVLLDDQIEDFITDEEMEAIEINIIEEEENETRTNS